MENINNILEIIEEEELDTYFLHEIILDAADSLACNINSGGLDSQIEFLVDICNWTPIEILKEIRRSNE